MRFKMLQTVILGGAVVVTPSFLAAQATGTLTAKDKKFIATAGEGSLKEIQFSQLALQKSSNDDVKTFAQKMVTDHTQLMDDMKPFAQQANVPPPTDLKASDKALYDQLNGLSGDAFDKKYISDMVKDHHQDLREFKAEVAATQDQEFKTTVSNGEKVIQEHTDMADKLANTNGVAPMGKKSCTM